MHALQYRPSKVGRPIGSQDKMPRVKKINAFQSPKHVCCPIVDHIPDSLVGMCKNGYTNETQVYTTFNDVLAVALPPAIRRQSNPEQAPNDFHPTLPLMDSEPYLSEALIIVDPRPFDPADAHCPATSTLDEVDPAAPADGSPGFADPFHFDWPHW